MPNHPLELAPEALRRICDPDSLGFESTASVPATIGTVGQDRALDSLAFGLEIEARGYNLFVSGATGSGRSTTVMAKVQETALRLPHADDWCYVYNFTDSYRPLAINLPHGMARALARDMDALVMQFRAEIPKAFESDRYQQQRQQVVTELEKKRQALYEALEGQARAVGLTVQFGPQGIMTLPLLDGRPMTPEEYGALPDPTKASLRERGEGLQDELVTFFKSVRDAEQDTNQALQRLDREIALFAVGHLVQGMAEQYKDHPRVTAYLEAVQADVVENHQNFRPQPPEEARPAMPGPRPDPFSRYHINVLVSRDGDGGAPVVSEFNPTYYNLVGRVDYQPAFGTLSTDYRLIKPGALHHANGGFLMVQARELLMNPFAWEGLKRCLTCEEIAIENIGEATSLVPTLTVRPEPIPLKVKVVLIGNREVFGLLYSADETFRKLFKVKADFDIDMDRNPENTAIYASFVRSRVDADHLLQFHKSGVAKIVEYGSRLREHQDKLSTRFGDMADIVTEATFWARRAGATQVMGDHVSQAIAAKEFRSSLPRDKTQEVIREGTIVIATEGAAVGQINGLSVLDTGDYTFGMPSRITARVSMGSGGVSNIERAIEMSGRIHSKGVLILSAFLASRYAQTKPLNLNASLTFEQLYNDVDGDSASSTELYALLSALSGLPLRQDLAVTGSVNQHGEVQAVGGVQFKVEGYYDLCAARGLTGTQGVMIPASNVRHIMLREDIVEAVSAGRFHLYAVSTVDEGIELLTGVPAGAPDASGAYPTGSVNALVDERISRFGLQLREFGRPAENGAKPVVPTPTA